jgi:Ca-activated chloride channel homolog
VSSSKTHRLARWGRTALALSLAAGCSTSPKPTSEPQTPSDAPPVSRPRQEEAPPAPPAASPLSQPQGAVAPSPRRAMPGSGAAMKPAGPPAMVRNEASAKMAEAEFDEVSKESRAVEKKDKAAELSRMAPPEAPAEPTKQGNTFAENKPNAFIETREDRFSTFAVDVDTASYTVARRYLNENALPPRAAVRVEEFVNYFKYHYTPPETGAFSVHLEGAPSPFDASHHFVRVGVQGKVVSRSQRKPAHLVFLVDTSGSMNQRDKLPLAKEAMKLAVKNLNENDTVALVTYAGGTRDVLAPTPATQFERIAQAIDSLESGGGTAMGSGMELAYRHAVKKASGSVVSRVVVLTDGDANIGLTTPDAMLNSIQGHVKEGVTLSTIGFGMGNYRDDLMERLADKGNGNCFYIDSFKEARKVFEQQLTGTLEVIAKDVKVQVEFDPAVITRYRLVGYENRDIADRDFRDDKVDAGEIGAGHSVTALYEVVRAPGAEAKALGTVRIRAKTPTGTEASEQAFPIEARQVRGSLEAASSDFRFALAVAATADVLRGAGQAESWSLATLQKLAKGATDGQADREEFVQLLGRAQSLLKGVAREQR